jgi:hypothetical protein
LAATFVAARNDISCSDKGLNVELSLHFLYFHIS